MMRSEEPIEALKTKRKPLRSCWKGAFGFALLAASLSASGQSWGAKASASVDPSAHAASASTLKRAMSTVDAANKELESVREESRKAKSALKSANSLIAKGRRSIAEGQKLQKHGRELKKHGKESAGEVKIALGAKAIDDGGRDVATGVTAVKGAQSTLNALHGKAMKLHTTLGENKKLVRAAESKM